MSFDGIISPVYAEIEPRKRASMINGQTVLDNTPSNAYQAFHGDSGRSLWKGGFAECNLEVVSVEAFADDSKAIDAEASTYSGVNATIAETWTVLYVIIGFINKKKKTES